MGVQSTDTSRLRTEKNGTELSPRSSARPAERGARAYRGADKKSKKGGIDFYWHGDKKDQIPQKHEGESKKSEGKKHSSSNSTVTRTVKASGKGELHYEKTNGLETLKAVGPDGAVLFDGPINTPEEKAEIPAEMLKWLEESLKNKPRRPDFRRHRDPFSPGSLTPEKLRRDRPPGTTNA